MIVVQLLPLSIEYSSFTFPTPGDEFHIMFWMLAVVQISPPFGETTCSTAGMLEFVLTTNTGALVPSLEL